MTNIRVSSATLQTVRGGSEGSRLLSSFAVVQAVTRGISTRVRIALVALQMVHGGSSGARLSSAYAAVQAVYTKGVPSTPRQRAWTFDFDGHTFYVLDLAEKGALLYDQTTGQWSQFDTTGHDGHWNMKNGFHWRTGGKVVAGDISNGNLYEMTPQSFLDEGWRPVVYEVRGVIFAADITHHRQYALRLVGSAGRTADGVAPVLRMQFSDDQAQTWSREYVVTLTSDTKQRIQFRSLGAFTAPGRIFRLYDTGGVKFIAYVVADMEVDPSGNASY